MIESVRFVNFRAYKEAYLEFHSGVNVIIGENDSGKTNVLRGIDLVANNHPRGDPYISDWGGDMTVELGIDGKEVGRFRNVVWDKKLEKFKAGTVNQYTLTGEEPFNAVGTGVPEIIKQYLNLSLTNIHFQLDGPFLLSKSPPDVAKHYNEIVNLEIIDTTISNIASTLRKERTVLKAEQATSEQKTEELKAYDWLPDAETELARLEKEQRTIAKLKLDWTALYALIDSHKKLMQADRKLGKIVKHEKAVNDLLKLKEEIRELEADRASLSAMINEHRSLTEADRELAKMVRHEATVKDLLQQKTEIESLRNDKRELATAIGTLRQLRKEESKCQEIVKHAGEAARLAELDAQIIEGIAEYNLLQGMVEKWHGLSDELSEAGTGLANLELEFVEAMPEACPIFDVECSYIKEARK